MSRERPAPEAELPQGRATCWRCHKPASLCVCARTPTVANRTEVYVLRHRHERGHVVGTARLAQLGLERVVLRDVVGEVEPPALGPRAAVLSPGEGARELSEIDPSERPEQLLVIDGTWRHARSLLRDNAWLRELPRVALTPSEPSRYGIRRQPAPECLSTIESIVLALQILEPQTPGLEGLLSSFESMVEEQRAFMLAPSTRPRYQRRRSRASRALPEELRRADPARFVVLYGETAPGLHERRRLVRLSALRPADGSCFDALLREGEPAPQAGHLAHMGLDPEDFAAALTPDAARRAWRAFLAPDDVLLSWHPWAAQMLAAFDAQAPRVHALKVLWSNVHHGRCGGLEALAERDSLSPLRCTLPGRAAERLGLAAAVWNELLHTAPRMARETGGPTG